MGFFPPLPFSTISGVPKTSATDTDSKNMYKVRRGLCLTSLATVIFPLMLCLCFPTYYLECILIILLKELEFPLDEKKRHINFLNKANFYLAMFNGHCCHCYPAGKQAPRPEVSPQGIVLRSIVERLLLM